MAVVAVVEQQQVACQPCMEEAQKVKDEMVQLEHERVAEWQEVGKWYHRHKPRD